MNGEGRYMNVRPKFRWRWEREVVIQKENLKVPRAVGLQSVPGYCQISAVVQCWQKDLWTYDPQSVDALPMLRERFGSHAVFQSMSRENQDLSMVG